MIERKVARRVWSEAEAMLPPFDPFQSFFATGDAWVAASTDGSIMERQRIRLRALLSHAVAQSPLYARLFAKRDVEGLQLADFPVMRKADLMRRFDDWVTDRHIRLDDLRRFVADPSRIADPYLGRYVVWESSGSCGVSAIFVQDASAMAVYDALEALRHPWPRLLQRWFDPWYATERIAFVGATDGHYASVVSAERLRRLNPALSKGMHDLSFLQPWPRLAKQLEEIAPTIVGTYPSAAMLLAEERAAGRLNIRPHEIWTGGETLTLPMRQFIEKTFECTVIDSYGASEFLTLACECCRGRLHVNSDWAILEPVDERGRPVPPGVTSATVLLTNLANRVQPLIRYDLGDRVTWSATACACGSPLPVIHVEGRSDDTLRFAVPGRVPVRVLPLALSTVIEEVAGLFDFQLEQTGPKALQLRTPLRGPDASKTVHRAGIALSAFLAKQGAANVDIHVATGRPNRRGPGGKVQRVLALPARSTPFHPKEIPHDPS